MRTPFVALWLISVISCLPQARSGDLPGFPLAAPGESEGPVHIQRILHLERDAVVVMDELAADGRPTREALLRIDRRGRVVERMEPPPTEPDGAPPKPEPLPAAVGGNSIEAREADGRFEIFLRGDDAHPIEVKMGALPRARSTRIEGVFLGPDTGEEAPDIAALAWRSSEDAAEVRGALVLDLANARAWMEQKRGLKAHLAGDYHEAADRFSSAWRTDPEDPLGAYNLACALARLGQEERALTYLWKAIDMDGPRIRVFAARDPDLDSLRSHPDFAAVAGPGGLLRLEKDR